GIGYVEHRTIPSRSMSGLSYSSGGSGSMGGPRGCSSYLPGLYDSEAEDDHCQQYPVYHPHPGPCSHTSQESLNSTNTAPQVSIYLFIFKQQMKPIWLSNKSFFYCPPLQF
ncbi:hypothetical protein GOODEAATRI_033576, partial [Goodea atripinnis]